VPINIKPTSPSPQMHHWQFTKTIVQTLLVLSILNLVYAAPVVPREVRDTGYDVVVVAENVTTASDRRRGTQGATTPLQYSSSSSSDGSPSLVQESLPLERSAPLQGSAPSSVSAPLSHLSDTDGQMPVHGLTARGSTTPRAVVTDTLQKYNKIFQNLSVKNKIAIALVVGIPVKIALLYAVLHHNKNKDG